MTHASVSVCADDSLPRPSAPKNLEASQISPTSLFLRWEWDHPNVALNDVEFNVHVWDLQQTESRKTPVKGLFYLVQDGLSRGKTYIISVLVKVNGVQDGVSIGVTLLKGECMAAELPIRHCTPYFGLRSRNEITYQQHRRHDTQTT